MATQLSDVEDLILNYDPEAPQSRFTSGTMAGLVAAAASDRLPSPPPWPAGTGPVAKPLHPAPPDDASLASLPGLGKIDALVVTWTAAEAAALAAIFTPDYLPSQWYEYRNGVASYIPLVTGDRSPFNSKSADMARYYHSLGLYFPCRIKNKNVLLFKCGLHLDYDGPAVPVRKLIAELTTTLKPEIVITTGTGGGINGNIDGAVSTTQLGDVVVAKSVLFDCQQQFKDAPWAKTGPFSTSGASDEALSLITPSLLQVNAAKVTGGRAVPKIWHDAASNVVTTDFFAFADTANTYGLNGKGRACDMGDAMVAAALTSAAVKAAVPNLKWYSIRNASDPEMPDAGSDIRAVAQQAGEIYLKYGAFTTAASAIATWAIIAAA